MSPFTYADDSTLIASENNVGALSDCFSDQLTSYKRWMTDNRLSLHLGKTECILIGSKRRLREAGDFRVSCDGLDVKRVETVCYLGVTLDQHWMGRLKLGVS